MKTFIISTFIALSITACIMPEEMKSKIGEYLPEDFDYRSRICHISGTYYG